MIDNVKGNAARLLNGILRCDINTNNYHDWIDFLTRFYLEEFIKGGLYE